MIELQLAAFVAPWDHAVLSRLLTSKEKCGLPEDRPSAANGTGVQPATISV